MQSPLKTIKHHQISLLVVFGLVLLAKAPAFLGPLYSVDAWIAATAADESKYFSDITLVLSQYRFGLAALFLFSRLFEYGAAPVAFNSVLLACGLLTIASLFSYLTIDPEGRRTPYLIFSAIFCLHPFTVEIFTFVDVALFASMSLVLGQLGGLILYKGTSRREWAGGVALIIAALSIYQITLHYIFITLLFASVAALMRGESLRPVPRAIIGVAVSAAVCLLMAKGINAILQIPSEARGSLISLYEIPGRIGALRDALVRSFYPPPRLVPPVTTGIAALALTAALFVSLRVVFVRKGISAVLLAMVALGAAVCWIAGLSIVGKTLWLVPRTLSAIAVFLGAAVALGWLGGGQVMRGILVSTTSLLVFGYIASNNRILYDQWRVNNWDAQQANRILARLETLQEFPQMKRLSVQGGFTRYRARLPTAFADLNMSSFAPGLFKNYTIQQTTGYKFLPPTPDQGKLAVGYCKTAPRWPASQSVTIIGVLGIVCLSD
ncbi:glucosyltransferase domain-containing protein [Microvirga sp. VF16]|uniref:glucosyltransferase domain-containing protein n=1 Tax=Microvirga sp. VF16 TaxID=2807101 RepID=UPI00193E976B|nr:glucosyltransferase domain-containing protein [Microvirga sp. VF16]QRM28277.1 hypothetical protein JO965_18825 [Microvirga sp. VF16]